MNDVFNTFLIIFVLVFFNDIMVYSNDLIEYVVYLSLVLEVLKLHSLYAKLSKCKFGVEDIEYLGHVILGSWVKANPSKIALMLEWPIPNSLIALRGFLGLTGSYRKFIRHYGIIATPLTMLLKKNSFPWIE